MKKVSVFLAFCAMLYLSSAICRADIPFRKLYTYNFLQEEFADFLKNPDMNILKETKRDFVVYYKYKQDYQLLYKREAWCDGKLMWENETYDDSFTSPFPQVFDSICYLFAYPQQTQALLHTHAIFDTVKETVLLPMNMNLTNAALPMTAFVTTDKANYFVTVGEEEQSERSTKLYIPESKSLLSHPFAMLNLNIYTQSECAEKFGIGSGKLFIDDKEIDECRVDYQYKGAFVQMRPVFENLGCSLEWNNNERSITLSHPKYPNRTIYMTLGERNTLNLRNFPVILGESHEYRLIDGNTFITETTLEYFMWRFFADRVLVNDFKNREINIIQKADMPIKEPTSNEINNEEEKSIEKLYIYRTTLAELQKVRDISAIKDASSFEIYFPEATYPYYLVRQQWENGQMVSSDQTSYEPFTDSPIPLSRDMYTMFTEFAKTQGILKAFDIDCRISDVFAFSDKDVPLTICIMDNLGTHFITVGETLHTARSFMMYVPSMLEYEKENPKCMMNFNIYTEVEYAIKMGMMK